MTAVVCEVAPESANAKPDDHDDLTHLICTCNEDVALCGTDLTEAVTVDCIPSADVCVVCTHLDFGPCPRCGEW